MQELNRVGVHSKARSPAFRAGASVINMVPSPGGYVSAYQPYSSVQALNASSMNPRAVQAPEVVNESTIRMSAAQLSSIGKTPEQLWNDTV